MVHSMNGRNILLTLLATARLVFWGQGASYGQASAEMGKIYWTNHGQESIQRSGLDGTQVETLVAPRGFLRPAGLALDLVGKQIYWSDPEMARIQRSDLDGRNFEPVVTGLHDPGNLALDLEGGRIYWTDSGTGSIQRCDLDGTHVETLVTGIIAKGLVLDIEGGWIYWSEPGTGRIQRSGLDGTHVETILTGLEEPGNIALDPDRDRIYWTASFTIQRSDLDGANVETILTGLRNPVDIAVDKEEDRIYWVEAEIETKWIGDGFAGYDSIGRMHRSDLDGANVETLRPQGMRAPKSIALDAAGDRIYWTEIFFRLGIDVWEGAICFSDLDGGNVEAFREASPLNPGKSYLGGIALDAGRGRIYWTDWGSGAIRRSYLDGSKAETLFSELENPKAIALDMTGGKVYWTEYDRDARAGLIWRGSLDGTSYEAFLTSFKEIEEIAIDVVRGQIYWIAMGSIHRLGLDGSDFETILAELEDPQDLALDADGGRIYWTDWGTNSIHRANLDGSDVETLITETLMETGLEAPQNIALDLINGEVYWTASYYDDYSDSGHNELRRANLDGSNVHSIAYIERPAGIALDIAEPISLQRALFTLSGHMGEIFSVSFSPDGTTLASAGTDNTIRLWEVSTGQLRTTLTVQERPSNDLSFSFSPDGATLASAGTDNTIRLWEVSTGQLKTTLEGRFSGPCLAFSPDGSILASGIHYWTIRLWEVSTGEPFSNLVGGWVDVVGPVVFSPDGATIATASRDKRVRLWDVSTGQLKASLEGHTNEVFSVSFSPDGRTLASGSRDGTVRLWDVSTGQPLSALVGHTRGVFSVSFSPDGSTLAGGGDNQDRSIRLWDLSTGQLKAVLRGHTDWVRLVSFSPDGRTLAGVSGSSVLLWDMSPYIGTPESREIQLSMGLPEQTALLANFPNPFNQETWIPFRLHAPAQVRLSIYDVRGALVRQIELGHRAAGQYLTSAGAAHWNGRDQGGQRVASGVYFYRLQAGSLALARKMVVAK